MGFWEYYYTSFHKSSLYHHFKRFSNVSTAAATILLVLPRLCFCPVVLYSVNNEPTALKKREPNCMNGCAPKDSKFSVSTTVYLQCMDLWKLVFNWLLLVWTAVSLCTIGWKERRARSNRSVWVKDTSRQCQCSDAQLQYSLQKFILFRKININLEATFPWIFPDS